MRLVSVFPLLSARGTDEISCRCETCGTEHVGQVSSKAGGGDVAEHDIYCSIDRDGYYCSIDRDGYFSGVQIIECFDDDETIHKA